MKIQGLQGIKAKKTGDAVHKKMSIADRANLVRRMEEEDEELLQDETGNEVESDEAENMQK